MQKFGTYLDVLFEVFELFFIDPKALRWYDAVLVNSLIAQPVERRTVNPQVPGSSPGRGATEYKGLQFIAALFLFRNVTST